MKRKIKLIRKDGVKQRYWKNYGSTYYHGTKEKNLPSILKTGIMPRQDEAVSEKIVYLTPHLNIAKEFAIKGSEIATGRRFKKLIKDPSWHNMSDKERGEQLMRVDNELSNEPGVILEVEIPDDKLISHNDHNEIESGYEVAYPGKINPESIKKIIKVK